MLDENKLYKQIKQAFNNVLPGAFESALKSTLAKQSNAGDEVCEQFGKSIDEAISEPLAKQLAAAIDYYVKNASINGTIITVGSPTTQTARINSPSPLTNGKVPNSLGIK